MISASRVGSIRAALKRFLISLFQSCIFDSCYAGDRLRKLLPLLPLLGENLAAFHGQPIVTPSSLSRLLDPAALDPPAFFKPVQQVIQRRHVKSQRAARAALDELRDFVTVSGLIFDEGEDEHLATAFFPLTIRLGSHIFDFHIIGGSAWAVNRRKTFQIKHAGLNQAGRRRECGVKLAMTSDPPRLGRTIAVETAWQEVAIIGRREWRLTMLGCK